MKNSFFSIKNLKSVVFLGTSPVFQHLKKINDEYCLSSEIITSVHQSNNIQNNINKKIIHKIDKSFKNYLKKKYDLKKTLFFSIGSRWIFKNNFIKFVNGNIINFHAARLPIDGGGGSFSWRIMKNDRINIMLLHKVTENIDTGPIISYHQNLFPKSCRIPKEFKKYCDNSLLEFYDSFIRKLSNGKKFEEMHQPNYLSSYYPRLDSNGSSWIDWNMSAVEIERFINAFDDPYKGSLTLINNKKVRLKKVQLHSEKINSTSLTRGLIIKKEKKWLMVFLDDKNYLLVEEVLDDKGKIIFKNLKAGDKFYTPAKFLEKQFSKRIKYNNLGKS